MSSLTISFVKPKAIFFHLNNNLKHLRNTCMHEDKQIRVPRYILPGKIILNL